MSTISISHIHPRSLKLLKSSNVHRELSFPQIRIKRPPICCTKLTPWEPSPVTYSPTETAGDNLLKKTTNIFETLNSENTAEVPVTSTEKLTDTSNSPVVQLNSENTAEVPVTSTEKLTDTSNSPVVQLQFLKWPMWLLGPSLLLGTGMVPTLWLPISSIFLGPNIASLLSLIGLDCIFNLGATLFLLMADSCARPKHPTQACKSKAPFTYQFWNIVATVTGFIIPLVMLYGSQKGFLQPQLSFISFAVLLGPYLLLLSVQLLTEMLTWHWQSPVWLVTPVVYEAYRVLQLMRGLKLGAELSAPAWIMHTLRGLVSWWVLILGMQLMRVAWFAGFTSRARQQQSSSAADG